MNVLVALVVAVAHAGPLVPRWSAEPIRYRLETVIDTPRSYLHVGRNNLEARATRQGIEADTTCRGEIDGKRWRVRCVLDHIAFQGRAVNGEADALQGIYSQYSTMLKGKTLEMTIADNGRVTSLNLVDMEKTDARGGEMLESIRQHLRRLFASLDLQLPKNGDDKGKSWRHRGSPMVLELMTRFGTAGGMALEHQVTGQADEIYDIGSKGRGSVTSGDTLEAGAGTLMRIETEGRGRFDAAAGQIIWREIRTQAKFTVSSINAGSGAIAYAQSAWMGRIEADGSVQRPTAITDQ